MDSFGAQGMGSFSAAAIRVGGVSIQYLESHPLTGCEEAPTIVLVHGLGLSHRYMMPLAQDLARDCHVYVPDQPGFGGSGHPKHVPDMAGLADALADWIRITGISHATLLGNSQGCQIIAQLATRHPDLVAAAVLQGPTAPPDERTWFWQAVRWRQNGRYNPPSLGSVTWGEYSKAGYVRTLRTFQHSLNDRIEEQLPRMTAPTLIVCGEWDPICPARWARQLAALPPHGRYIEIPGVAHTLCYTAPAELANITREFLKIPAPI